MKFITVTSLFVIAIVNAQSNENISTDEEKNRNILSIFGPPPDQPNPVEQPTTSRISTAVEHCGIRNVGGLDSGTITTLV